jgi:hypothetical protein
MYSRQRSAKETTAKVNSSSPKSPYSRLRCLSRSPVKNTDDNRLLQFFGVEQAIENNSTLLDNYIARGQ